MNFDINTLIQQITVGAFWMAPMVIRRITQVEVGAKIQVLMIIRLFNRQVLMMVTRLMMIRSQIMMLIALVGGVAFLVAMRSTLAMMIACSES